MQNEEKNNKKTEGTITKINKTRAVVSIDVVSNHGTYAEDWNVPFNIMTLKESK